MYRGTNTPNAAQQVWLWFISPAAYIAVAVNAMRKGQSQTEKSFSISDGEGMFSSCPSDRAWIYGKKYRYAARRVKTQV